MRPILRGLSIAGAALVARTRYWFGLFSHQRETAKWKGVLEVSLGTVVDDEIASGLLPGVAP